MKYKIILAGNSPRRRELLAGLDVNFEVKVLNGIDESYPDDLDAYQVAEFIAQKKAEAYRSLLDNEESSLVETWFSLPIPWLLRLLPMSRTTRKARESFWVNRKLPMMPFACSRC